MDIASRIGNIIRELPEGVKLVAVSKTHPVDAILQAYSSGHKVFGENKVQELLQKYELLPKDIEWHLIGHLQTNKVKYIVPFVNMIHGVDSLKLLQTIDQEATKNNRVVNCLFQVKIAKEETKFGMDINELINILNSGVDQFKNVRICGLMGMATFTSDESVVRDEFKRCKKIFDEIKTQYFSLTNDFRVLSMGMSDDYKTAIEEGSTMVRIGSKIFGERTYI